MKDKGLGLRGCEKISAFSWQLSPSTCVLGPAVPTGLEGLNWIGGIYCPKTHPSTPSLYWGFMQRDASSKTNTLVVVSNHFLWKNLTIHLKKSQYSFALKVPFYKHRVFIVAH